MTRGEWVDPAAGRVLFASVADEWLAAALHLKTRPRASYVSLLRTRVLPTWATVPLSEITHEATGDWVAQLVADGLSGSRIRQAVYVLSAACEYAVRTGRLIRNLRRG